MNPNLEQKLNIYPTAIGIFHISLTVYFFIIIFKYPANETKK